MTFLPTFAEKEVKQTFPERKGDVARRVEMINNGEIALHTWIPKRYEFVVAYVHGLQSHAGWSWELAMDIADRNGAFFVIDRYGSGVSKGQHDVFPDAERTVNDHAEMLQRCIDYASGRPVLAVGHCLGGSVLSATLSMNSTITRNLKKVYIVSSWLGKMSSTFSASEIDEIRNSECDRIWDADLKATEFTENPQYQDFIRHDDLAIRGVQERSRKHILALEELYLGNRQVNHPNATFIGSYVDPVIDVIKAMEMFRHVYPDYSTITLLNSNKHYIPFTLARWALVDQLVAGGSDG